MSNQKHSKDTAVQEETRLCTLTEEELAQVAGGVSPSSLLINPGYFPLGTFPIDLFRLKNPTVQFNPAEHVIQPESFGINDSIMRR